MLKNKTVTKLSFVTDLNRCGAQMNRKMNKHFETNIIKTKSNQKRKKTALIKNKGKQKQNTIDHGRC